MTTDAAELLKGALSLPAEARSALIESLLESLDAEIDENAHEAWREEIRLRLRQIDSGAVEMMRWDDVRRKLRDRLRH